MPLPDDIDDGVGVLIGGDGLGVPFGASTRAGVMEGEITCVLGCGPIGLGMTVVHRYLGARPIAVDVRPSRLAMAERCGAWRTINAKDTPDLAAALLDLTDGIGPAKSFECAGQQATLDAAIDATAPEGTVVQVGHGPQTLDPQKLVILRNLRVMGNWICHFKEWQNMVAAVRAGCAIERIITARYPIAEAQAAYDRFADGFEGKFVLLQ